MALGGITPKQKLHQHSLSLRGSTAKNGGITLRQTGNSSQTGKEMEAKASRALNNPHSAKTTKTLAATLVSQSNKKR